MSCDVSHNYVIIYLQLKWFWNLQLKLCKWTSCAMGAVVSTHPNPRSFVNQFYF